jgi:type II secretory pathway pseudopilin PulG
MKQKYLLIEIGIMGLILIILCGVMLPKFLSSQRTGEAHRLINNMQMLVDAIEAYQADHGGVPAAFLKPMDNVLLVQRPVYNDISRQYFVRDINKPYQFFYDNGYLDRMPDFGMASELFIPLELKAHSVQTIAGMQKLEKFYLSYAWGQAATEDRNLFLQNYHGLDGWRPSPNLFDTDGLWIEPVYFYSPTNGFSSAGFLYVDSVGRHSPWE